MTDNEFKYWAFLSYSQQDNREKRADTQEVGSRCWGNWLHDALKAFSIPAEFVGQINGRGEIIPERIDPVFWDAPERSEDATLTAEIRKALEQSICLIVICSPRSAKSLQVNEVVRYFKQLGRSKHILPIVVAGEPQASDGNKPGILPEDECFVPALRHPVRPDGTLDTTRRAGKHIFVDARHGFDKREILADDHRNAEVDLEMAKIQLIALLLGVGFNGLWWREQKRHFFDFAEAKRQAREALNLVEETQRQLQEAQRQTREAENKALEIQNLPRDVHGQIQEAQSQTREAQRQLQEFQNKVRETQTQLEEARHRALAAESKVLEAQNLVREVQSQLEENRNLAREAQNKVLEMRNLSQDVPNQIQEVQNQVQEFQNQARSAQSQLEEARNQVCEAQSKVLEAQHQAREAQNKVREIQDKSRNARRLAKVFALLAVLALLTAGIATSMAWRQRKGASQALAMAAAEKAGDFNLVKGGVEQVRQLLWKIGGAEQDEYRRRSLDQLAASIPLAEIPEALKASSVILNDQQRSRFQKWLLLRLGWVNPVSAMNYASVIERNIVNDEGLSDSGIYFQLAVLDNWLKTDLPGAFSWVCQLSDADSRQRALKQFSRWVKSQPDSESKSKVLATCIGELAKTDISGALALAESLPEEAWRSTVIVRLWIKADPFASWEWINSLDFPPEIIQPRTAPWPWEKFLLNANLGGLTIFPVEIEMLSNTTNGPIQIQPKE